VHADGEVRFSAAIVSVPVPSIDILLAKQGEACYLPSFLHSPIDVQPQIRGLGRDLVDIVMGRDPSIGIVPFGVITEGPDGPATILRGTQMPMGTWDEWLADFTFAFDPFDQWTGARWERGFHAVSDSLYVGTGTPLAVYMVEKAIKTIAGHSLGGPTATNTGAAAAVDLLVVIESPNPGNQAFADYVNSRVKAVRSYWNPRDKIGEVPPAILGGVPVAPKILLDPNSTTPPIADTLWDNHNLTHCRMMMEAVP
jgi:hypothetical protein